jgi:hypothetical protein
MRFSGVGPYQQAGASAEHRLRTCWQRASDPPTEGKYVDSGWKREALTVRAAFGAGVLATRGLLDTSGDVWAVPAPFIAWMLGD